MFIVTMNRKSIRKISVAALCGVLLAVAAFAAMGVGRTVSASAGAEQRTVHTTQDMVDFLLGYGVEANAASAEVTKIRIPKKFDDDFRAFHDVIEEGGMSLEKYRGKEADKWVLEAVNKAPEGEKAYAVLLVRQDKVIGAYLILKPSGNVESLRARPALAAQTDSSSAADDGIPKVGAQGIVSAEAPAPDTAQAVYREADMPIE